MRCNATQCNTPYRTTPHHTRRAKYHANNKHNTIPQIQNNTKATRRVRVTHTHVSERKKARARTHRIVSYRIVSYRIVSYRIVSYRIVSYRIVSYRIVSYRIVSYRIASHRMLSLLLPESAPDFLPSMKDMKRCCFSKSSGNWWISSNLAFARKPPSPTMFEALIERMATTKAKSEKERKERERERDGEGERKEREEKKE